MTNFLFNLAFLLMVVPTASFVRTNLPQNIATRYRPFFRATEESDASISLETTTTTTTNNSKYNNKNNNTSASAAAVVGVVAPLHYLGPYPCLTLRFPHFPSAFQVCNFLLDTGANVNTIHLSIAQQCNLPVALSSRDLPQFLGTAGMGGSVATATPTTRGMGDVYLLGDCQLEGLPPPPQIFLRNLTAAALPHASPTDGLLGQMFLQLFQAVEFDWRGTDGDPPTVIFYFVNPPLLTNSTSTAKNGGDAGVPIGGLEKERLTRVPIQRWAGLIALNLTLNGTTQVTALIDTGSPITVIHPTIANQLGIKKKEPNDTNSKDDDIETDDGVVMAGGVDGKPIVLHRSQDPVSLQAGSEFDLGARHVFVGELPGLQLAFEMMTKSLFKTTTTAGETVAPPPPPAVLLGLDFLRSRTYRLILQHDCVWMEAVPTKVQSQDT